MMMDATGGAMFPGCEDVLDADGDYEDDDKGKGHERTTKIEMLIMLIKRNAAVDNVTQAENTCNDASRQ
jgi:hypothetical protein